VTLVVGEVASVDEARQFVTLKDGLPLGYDHLVLATGSRIVPEAIEHFDTEAHHFYTAEAAARLRAALDAFDGGRIVIGIAGMPYKCPPAPLEVAFLIESELRDRKLRAEGKSPLEVGIALERMNRIKARPIPEPR
jgi:sulfide:quinone oxidoreductase